MIRVTGSREELCRPHAAHEQIADRSEFDCDDDMQCPQAEAVELLDERLTDKEVLHLALELFDLGRLDEIDDDLMGDIEISPELALHRTVFVVIRTAMIDEAEAPTIPFGIRSDLAGDPDQMTKLVEVILTLFDGNGIHRSSPV